MTAKFIHLSIHTEYSLIDGLPRIKQLIDAAKRLKMPAIAITDHCNLFGMVKFYRAAIDAGLKPIIGADILIHNETTNHEPYRLILLCQNQIGYQNLTQLVSKSYLHQEYGVGVIHKEWLLGLSEGLLALSGGMNGDIGQALLKNETAQAEACLAFWLAQFKDRFYIELQRIGLIQEEDYNQAAMLLAEKHQIPLVATNNVRFIDSDDFEAHEARVCIHQGRVLEDPKRPRIYRPEQFLRSAEEMTHCFQDIPEAIKNTVVIAKKCNFKLQLGRVCLPNFPLPENISLDDYFISLANQGLDQRLAKIYPDEIKREEVADKYHQRLEMELAVIIKMGFQGYFLIVADFIEWSKKNRIPVGPGRGSGPGSLVAYSLGITELDPLNFDLLFERFLNPERASMPDFDIDFCMEGRDRVIEYVASKYGKESVSQIITYGSMAARAVVRDVGRILAHPYGFVDKLAKLIPFEVGMTLKKALNQDETLHQRYHEEEEVKALIDLALKLEGLPRNAGKHAGGVVIAPSVLTDFTPLYCEAGGENLVTQLDKDDVEAVGLVKFDFLGLRTLTIIDWALQTINAKRKSDPLEIASIPMDDEKVFELLCRGNTTAVFQLESRGMKDLIKKLQPVSFHDIVPLVALFRPGPLQSGMVEDFISRRHGRAKIEYPHPALEPVLKSTYGVILYQEQVMQITQVLAGYTLGRADLLRRAMGKKKPEEMAKQRAGFVSGARERGVKEQVASHIFDLMEKFAGYAFNKPHSAAYALLSYQTAWLKTRYPAEYMAAVLSADMDHTDKVVRLIEDSKSLGLKISPPCINVSDYRFTVGKAGEIVYGLGAIKGVGQSALENCLESRASIGPFKNLFDFCRRIDARRVNRRVLESLIRSGSFDCFGISRAMLLATLDKALMRAEQTNKNEEVGQQDLFISLHQAGIEIEEIDYVHVPEWSDEIRLQGEKETLGGYLTGHPMDRYESELSQLVSAKILDIKPNKEKTITIAGLVLGIKPIFTKKGNRMGVLTLDDRSGRIEIIVFSELFAECRELIETEAFLVVEGEVSIDAYTESYRMTARKILGLEQLRNQAKSIQLTLFAENCNAEKIRCLTDVLAAHRGGQSQVDIFYKRETGSAQITLGKEWKVRITASLINQLQEIFNLNIELLSVIY